MERTNGWTISKINDKNESSGSENTMKLKKVSKKKLKTSKYSSKTAEHQRQKENNISIEIWKNYLQSNWVDFLTPTQNCRLKKKNAVPISYPSG